jgi:hypothetical protein
MTALRVVAIALIILGVLGLVYDKFSYTEDSQEVKLGPIEFEVKEKKTVNVPVWAGVAAIVVGAGLLVVPFKHS